MCCFVPGIKSWLVVIKLANKHIKQNMNLVLFLQLFRIILAHDYYFIFYYYYHTTDICSVIFNQHSEPQLSGLTHQTILYET